MASEGSGLPMTCDAGGLGACGATLTACIMHNSTDTCDCRGNWLKCLVHIGCTNSTVDPLVAGCESEGCTASQCSPYKVADTPVPCNSGDIAKCATSLSTCIAANFSDVTATCECRGSYDACLLGAGCSSAMVDGVVQGCIISGCSEAQCNTSAVTTKVEEPVVNVVEEVPVGNGTCGSAGISGCSAAMNSCSQKNSTNSTALCLCHGGFDKCIYQLGCPITTVNQIVQACEDSGCSAAQCAYQSKSAIPPVAAADNCQSTDITACLTTMGTCIAANPFDHNNTCTCHGGYDKCILGLGCPAQTVANAVKGCEDNNCTAAQCAAQ